MAFGGLLVLRLAAAEDSARIAEPAVRWEVRTIPDIPCVVHLLSVPRRAGLRLRARIAGGVIRAKAGLSEIVAAEPAPPLAAINASFFVMTGAYAGDPVDLVVADGRLRSTAAWIAGGHGSAFWVDPEEGWHIGRPELRPTIRLPDGDPEPLDIVDGDPGSLDDRWAVLTRNLGTTALLPDGAAARCLVASESWPGNMWTLRGTLTRCADPSVELDIPEHGFLLATRGEPRARRLAALPEGAEVRVSLAGEDAGRVREALAGGLVLREGKRTSWMADEPKSPFVTGRHPRTAIGMNEETLFLLAADGRQPGYSMGLSLGELADFLASIGAREGLNLDGGGSTTLWFEGSVRNKPSDGRERKLSDALLLFAPAGTGDGSEK